MMRELLRARGYRAYAGQDVSWSRLLALRSWCTEVRVALYDDTLSVLGLVPDTYSIQAQSHVVTVGELSVLLDTVEAAVAATMERLEAARMVGSGIVVPHKFE